MPLICGDDKLEGLGYPDRKYGAIYVPAGGRVDFTYEGVITPAPYIGGMFIGQYNFILNISAGGTFLEDRVGLADSGYTSGPTPYPFTENNSYHFVNRTGVSQVFGIEAYAIRRLTESSITWSVKFDIPGGQVGVCNVPVDGSELFGPNPSLGQQCPPCHGGTSNSVDTKSGNEHYQLPGVSVGGRGPGLDFQIGYNSLDAAHDGSVGRGWRHSYDMALGTDRGGVRTVFQETGSTVPFTKSTSGSWVAPPRFDAKLTQKSNGEWEFVRSRAEVFTFRDDGRLSRIADRNGYETNGA